MDPRQRARDLSPKTIRNYADSAVQLLAHDREQADVRDLAELKRTHVRMMVGQG